MQSLSDTTEEFTSGSDALIRTLEKELEASSLHMNLLLINIYTLLRNRAISTHLNVKEIVSGTLDDLTSLIDVVLAKQQIPVVIYSAKYQFMIPNRFQRPLSDKQKIILAGVHECDKILKNLLAKQYSSQVSYKRLGNNIQSYYQLQALVRQLASRRHVIMISNIPLDYHVHRVCTSFKLLRSFTGALVNATDLHNVVFKVNVPFLRITHALLGDKVNIKSNLSRKDKRMFLEVADEENWMHKSESYIRTSIRKRGWIERGMILPVIGQL